MPKTILVIEDDRDILDLMRYILSDEGYLVISATNSEPLSKLPELQPAMILLDNNLIDGSGRDFCKQLKSDPSSRHIPIVLFSANAKLEEMARESGADDYLKKPFDLEDLLNMVKQHT
jgi:DNA-binding response OmpR family regulator